MNGWHGFTGLAGCALAAMLPACVMAAGFEDSVVVAERTESFLSPESVLVDDGVIGEPSAIRAEQFPDHATDEFPAYVADESGIEAAPPTMSDCQYCGGAGCASCASFSSCTDDGCGRGTASIGWLNRRLGYADPRWVAQVDALMLWQGNIASRPLLQNPGTGLTALDVNQAQTVMSAGPRYALFFNVDECRTIEGNYFNVRSFADSEPLPAGIYNPVNMPALFAPPTTASILETNGQIQSAELNWRRRRCGSPITWLSGFRWVEWNQSLRLVDAASPTVASIDSQVGNNLYGGQVGMDLSLWEKQDGPIRVNGIGKAGVFYNNAFQRTSETVQGGILRGPESAVANATSFFGEVGMNGSVRLTRWLAWRAGYSVFWLSGVAVPANQLSLVSLSSTPVPATINTGGSVLLHGVTTGLEARW